MTKMKLHSWLAAVALLAGTAVPAFAQSRSPAIPTTPAGGSTLSRPAAGTASGFGTSTGGAQIPGQVSTPIGSTGTTPMTPIGSTGTTGQSQLAGPWGDIVMLADMIATHYGLEFTEPWEQSFFLMLVADLYFRITDPTAGSTDATTVAPTTATATGR